MMEKKSKISIDLSSSKKVSVANAFYKWAFQGGRAFVVLIELVALGALGYRFIVDSQIVDLHDQIEQQAALVQFQSKDELKFRGIQDRLFNIKTINEETSAKIEIMNEVLDAIASGAFTSTNLSVDKNIISFSGDALSVFTVEDFVNKLQEFPQVTSITIDEITTSSTGIKFTLRITLIDLNAEV